MTITKRCTLLLLIFLGGCAVSTDNTIVTQPPQITGKASQASKQQSDLPTTVAILPFTNSTDSKFAWEAVRKTMANHFATRNYRWVHWRDVDARLKLAGYDDPATISQLPPAKVAGLLGVDGLIYGNVTYYNKTFAGIYSQISVGVDLRFVNARGKVLWQVKDVKRSRAGGVSTTPVGLLMNALVAAKHLYGDINLYRAADDLGRDLADQLPEPATLAQAKRPAITNVVHSGVGRILKYGDTLDIGLEGDPGMTAVAMIEGLGLVDLKEVEPGQYVGQVNIRPDINLNRVAVVGRLQSPTGQTSSWISPYGLLSVDNAPPAAVNALQAVSRNAGVQLSWQPPADDDVAGYQVSYARTQTGEPVATFNAPNASYLLGGLENFVPVYVSVAAIDKAGNIGAALKIATLAAPDPRFAAAKAMPANLPPVISGTWRLTATGNPYYLRGKSRLATDGTLLVGPGVEFRVAPSASLTVMGELQVYGSAAAPVTATGDANGFDSFLILQSSLPVTITGLKVTGAGIPVAINAGNPSLADSTLAQSRFNALTIGGSARPVIKGCTISGANASGVIIQGQAQPVFEGNRFIDNQPFHLQNGSSYQVNVSGNTFNPPASATTMLGDLVY